MSTHSTSSETPNRRSQVDRRGEDRRQSTRGLFEFRARKDRHIEDRRQAQRRTERRFKWAFWRGSSA